MKLGQPDPRSGHQWTLSEPRQPDELFEPGIPSGEQADEPWGAGAAERGGRW